MCLQHPTPDIEKEVEYVFSSSVPMCMCLLTWYWGSGVTVLYNTYVPTRQILRCSAYICACSPDIEAVEWATVLYIWAYSPWYWGGVPMCLLALILKRWSEWDNTPVLPLQYAPGSWTKSAVLPDGCRRQGCVPHAHSGHIHGGEPKEFHHDLHQHMQVSRIYGDLWTVAFKFIII